MSELWERLLIGWGELAEVLPGLLAAAVIMFAGYFVARQLQRWTDRTLERLHFKRLADAGGFTEAAGRVRLDPVRAIGKLIFWLAMLVVVLLASSALGPFVETRPMSQIQQVFEQAHHGELKRRVILTPDF